MSKAALACLLWFVLFMAACQSSPPTPTITPVPTSPPPAPTATATPRRQEITFTEEYLSAVSYQFGYSKAHWDGNRVNRVTVNVQADGEVYWKVWAERYTVDVLAILNPVIGTRVTLEDGRIRFPVFDVQWIGSSSRRRSTVEPLNTAIFGMQDAVSEAIDLELAKDGWVPVAVTANDEKLIVTVETR